MMEETKILLVDDEELVLRSIQKTLLRAGFDVETAGDASSGLALFEAARGGGGPSITVNVQGSILSERDVRSVVLDALRTAGIDTYGMRAA